MTPSAKPPRAAAARSGGRLCIALSFTALVSAGPAALAQDPPELSEAHFPAALRSAERMPRLHSLLVSHRGRLVLERYFNGRDRDDIANVKSVSKSIISALVGIAVEAGLIDGTQQPIGDFFTRQLSGTDAAGKRAITVGHLLSMQAGLETTSNRNYGAWVLSNNWVDAVLRQPMQAQPGTAMIYSTGNMHLLSAILTQVSGRSTLQFARDVLAEPLGFRLAPWPTDRQGIYFGGNDMELTPRQMIAFGELYLNGGRANGRQIVPEAWVEASLRPRAISPREGDRYYGYGWWLRDMAGFLVPYAWGYGGQFIVLVPELDLVIVTTSVSTPGADRRGHLRGVYNLVEYDVIAPVAARR